jgi:hypothetical protein
MTPKLAATTPCVIGTHVSIYLPLSLYPPLSISVSLSKPCLLKSACEANTHFHGADVGSTTCPGYVHPHAAAMQEPIHASCESA